MDDLKYLKLAVKLSRKGLGYTEPNPMVGAVIVKNGEILATGYHKKFGNIHAERMALEKTDETDTTLYISLEPCCHHGKTPPCTDIIIKKKVKKVVIASIDPNPIVGGKGIKILKENGIEVAIGQLDNMNREYNAHYFTNMEKKRSYITLRAGISIDGKLTDKKKDSRWMTSKQLRKISHDLRSEFSAIMTGYNTVIEDNPNLNIRTEKWKDKKLTRIILDSKNRLQKETHLNIFKNQEQYPTYIFSSNNINIPYKIAPNLDSEFRSKVATGDISSANTKNCAQFFTPCPQSPGLSRLPAGHATEKVTSRLNGYSPGGTLKDLPYHFYVNNSTYGLNLNEILDILYKNKISSILIEGGGKLISSFLKEKLFDEIILFTEKKIIGGKDSVELFEYGTLISEPVSFSSSSLTEFDSGYIFRGKK